MVTVGLTLKVLPLFSPLKTTVSPPEETYFNVNGPEVFPTLKVKIAEAGAKAASKAYAGSYLDSIKDQAKGSNIEYQYDGKKTPNAFDPFKPYLDDKRLGDMSPMTKIKMPPKPKTGAMV